MFRRYFKTAECNAMTVVLGCDPGLHGAVCLMEDGAILANEDIPTVECFRKSGKCYSEVDVYALANLLDGWIKRFVIIHRATIERVSSRPTDGHMGAFSFGHTYGAMRMALASHFIPCEPVDTAVWRKGVGIPGRTPKGDKSAVVAKANELWPEHSHLWRAKCHADRAEAALIAWWCLESKAGIADASRWWKQA